ncbi:MAG TPA: alpha/beta fold hydrolase [Myxococcota bacterium]|nr:alpha/beta fold hydrolase [Myxococcota bacterium]
MDSNARWRRALIGSLVAATLGGSAAVRAGEPALPVVFVHGFSGSAQQYETQALRWASNGYPKPVTAIDRRFVGFTLEQLDAFIDAVLAQTGDTKVYAIGHSAGTFVMTSYLNSSPERAARVAKYIGIDGASNATCPGGVDASGEPNVPCMGVWARGSTTRMVGPDHNVYLSEQGHTQSVTSPESFAAQYEFLTGEPPQTTLILPGPPRDVTIAGRALNFPDNTGIDGAVLELWEVLAITGERARSSPEQVATVDASGSFGPWPVHPAKRYEINVIRQADDGPRYQHFYYEPWIRSDHLVRLNISPIGSTLSNTIREHAGPSAGASIVRQKEWWGSNDVDASNVDALEVTTSVPKRSTLAARATCALLGGPPQQCDVEAVGNIVTPGTAPYAASTIAMIAFDVGADGVSDTSALVSLGPFLSGIDTYMPAPDAGPRGVVTFHVNARREPDDQVIRTPNWPMDGDHFMTVTFREWTQQIDTWTECKLAGLCR